MKKNNRLNFLIMLSLIITAVFSIAYSQDTNKIKPEANNNDKQTVYEEKKNKPQKKKTYNFIPTEKITADSSVSFPVDI